MITVTIEAIKMTKQFAEVNIKEDMPTAAEAIELLKSALAYYKERSPRFLVIIRGYGSTEKGGVICSKARKFLIEQKNKGAIKSVVFGENMSIFNQESRELKERCCALSCYMDIFNQGITLIEL